MSQSPKPALSKQSSKQSSIFAPDSDDTDNLSDDSDNSLFNSKKGENPKEATASQHSIKSNRDDINANTNTTTTTTTNKADTNLANSPLTKANTPTKPTTLFRQNSSSQSLREKILAEKAAAANNAKSGAIPQVNVIPNTPSVENKNLSVDDSADSSNTSGMNNWYKDDDLKNIA